MIHAISTFFDIQWNIECTFSLEYISNTDQTKFNWQKSLLIYLILMAIINWNRITFMVFAICLFATLGLSIYSIYRFYMDEDVTLVKITKFHSSKDSICMTTLLEIAVVILECFLDMPWYNFLSSFGLYFERWNKSVFPERHKKLCNMI